MQVDCRTRKSGVKEPRCFVMDNHRLWVARVLHRHEDAQVRRFRVRTMDRREFILVQDAVSGEWQLGAVAAPQAT